MNLELLIEILWILFLVSFIVLHAFECALSYKTRQILQEFYQSLQNATVTSRIVTTRIDSN